MVYCCFTLEETSDLLILEKLYFSHVLQLTTLEISCIYPVLSKPTNLKNDSLILAAFLEMKIIYPLFFSETSTMIQRGVCVCVCVNVDIFFPLVSDCNVTAFGYRLYILSSRKPTEWEIMFVNYTFDKGLLSSI